MAKLALLRTPDRSVDFAYEVCQRTRCFDYQDAARKEIVAHLLAGDNALLAVGSGLGKTLTTVKIIEDFLLFQPAVVAVVSPGGLIDQHIWNLIFTPWGERTKLHVIPILTKRELLNAKCHVGHVYLINKALPWKSRLSDFGLVVLDEGHTMSNESRRALTATSTLTLAVTATPFLNKYELDELVAHKPEAIFYLDKTEYVMEKVGTAKPVLEVVSLDNAVDLADYWRRLVAFSTAQCHNSYSLRNFCVYIKVYSKARNYISLPSSSETASILTATVRRAGLMDNTFYKSIAVDGLSRQCIATKVGILWEGMSWSKPYTSDRKTEETLQLSLLQEEVKYQNCGLGDCDCCGLTEECVDMLYRWQMINTPSPGILAEYNKGIEFDMMRPVTFTTGLIRLPDEEQARRAYNAHRSNACLVSLLVASMSAKQRSVTIKKFTSFGGLRGKLYTFKRGVESSTNPLVQLIFDKNGLLGRYTLGLISSFLVYKKLLIADRTIDLGYDLHRVLDCIILPRICSDREEFLQIVGRATRIAVDKKEQGKVTILAMKYRGTLDELFSQHVANGRISAPYAFPDKTNHELVCEEISEYLDREETLNLKRFFDTAYKRRRVT